MYDGCRKEISINLSINQSITSPWSYIYFNNWGNLFLKRSFKTPPTLIQIQISQIILKVQVTNFKKYKCWNQFVMSTFTMRKDLLNLYVLVWIGKKLLKFVKTISSLLNNSKNFSLHSSDLLNLYVLVSISKNVMFYAFGMVQS